MQLSDIDNYDTPGKPLLKLEWDETNTSPYGVILCFSLARVCVVIKTYVQQSDHSFSATYMLAVHRLLIFPLNIVTANVITVTAILPLSPYRVIYTHLPLLPSSIIWYYSVSWEVNRHTVRHTGSVSIVLQLWLVPGWEPNNRRLAPPCGPNDWGMTLLSL